MPITRRMVLVGLPASAAVGGCEKQASAAEQDFVDHAPWLRTALMEAAATGQELRLRGGRYFLGSSITVGAVRVRCDDPVELVYSGERQVRHVLGIGADGGNVSLLGSLTFSGSRRANIGLYIDNQSATEADLVLGDITARSCRMANGHGFNDGAGGVICRGNFRRLRAAALFAHDISREAGSGVVGTNGTTGVEVSLTNGYGVRDIEIGTVGAREVTTDDRPGSPTCYDADGVYLFQPDVSGARLSVGRVDVVNAQGRALKILAYQDATFGNIQISRSISGITDGTNEIALQAGYGQISDVSIRYSGPSELVHGQGTTCITTYTSRNREHFGPTSISNLSIQNETTGVVPITCVVGTAFGGSGGGPAGVSLRDIVLAGRPAAALLDIGENGTRARADYHVDVDGFEGGVADAVVLTHGDGERLSISLKNARVMGRGATIAKRRGHNTPLSAATFRLRGDNAGLVG